MSADPTPMTAHTDSAAASVIHAENVNYYFGSRDLRKQILFDVNLEIAPGEIVILTGPSGSGKTTLLTLIGALRSAQEGSIKVLGKELRGGSQSELVAVRRRIGYIFQLHNLLESLTVAQNVEMSLALHSGLSSKQKRERSVEMLEAVGLGDRADAYSDQLSGGQSSASRLRERSLPSLGSSSRTSRQLPSTRNPAATWWT